MRSVVAVLVTIALVAVATPAAIAATEPADTNPRSLYGEPPNVGYYELSGAGSHFLVWRDGAGRYRLSLFRLRVRRGSASECRAFRNRLATVGGDHALRPLLVHRIGETELSYGSTRVYEYAATEQDRADVSIDGRHFPGVLNVDIGQGPTPEKPVVGAISIGTEGLDCTIGFTGSYRR
jgi:hypothetical protein